MKIWITKYALQPCGVFSATQAEVNPTNGIAKIDVNRYDVPNEARETEMYCQEDWHTSKDAAMMVAEKMRVEEVKKLHARINELNALCFVEKREED